jgi:hypothetical protein
MPWRIENLPHEWLTIKTDLETLMQNSVDLPESIREKVRSDVQRFAAEMQEADELWRYDSGDESWERKCGSTGLVILRNGEIVTAIQLMMN